MISDMAKNKENNSLSSSDRLIDRKLDLLQAEMGIIQSSAGDTVDSLWKIRSLSLTLWVASLSLGLGGFTSGLNSIPPLLILSGFIPILLAWIDSTYNMWYRHLAAREQIIQDFINDTDFVLPSTNQPMTLDSVLDSDSFTFPIYDLSGSKSYGNSPRFHWECSRLRSLTDNTPFFIYSSQLILTSLVLSIYGPALLRSYYVPVSIGITLILYVLGMYRKSTLKNGDDSQEEETVDENIS